jgi:hypothetical protein
MTKILDFKTVSPLFEMERDGIKPFTTRLIDGKDARFRALSQWKPEYNWAIRITCPSTGASFIRRIETVSSILYWYKNEGIQGLANYNWLIILMGELIQI